MIRELISLALNQISAAKGRSFLTILGILIGIMTIILITTVLESYSASINEGISDLGVNTFQLQRNENTRGPRRERKYRPPVNRYIREYIYENCPSVKLVGSEYWGNSKVLQFMSEKTNPNIQVCGGTSEFTPNNAFELYAGRDINEDDVRSARNVIILGWDIVEKIFPANLDPIGQMVKFDGHRFKVIGIFQKKKSAFGGSKNNLVIIPIGTFAKLYGEYNRSTNVTVQANPHWSWIRRSKR